MCGGGGGGSSSSNSSSSSGSSSSSSNSLAYALVCVTFVASSSVKFHSTGIIYFCPHLLSNSIQISCFVMLYKKLN